MLASFLSDQSEKGQLKKAVYKAVHRYGPLQKSELLERFHIPNTTLTRMMTSLERQGLIRICGQASSSGGRPPLLYEIIPEGGSFIGIDISRSRVIITLFNVKFVPLCKAHFPLTPIHTPKKTMEQIIDSIWDLMEEKAAPPLLGIGIGAVGPLDRANGIILNPDSFPAPGWRDIAIVQQLKTHFQVPILLNNGANTAALAEFHTQSHEEGSLLYCLSGHGIRSGLIRNGQIQSDQTGDASSFGHMVIQVDGRACACGKKGCLAAYTTYRAILSNLATQGITATTKTLLTHHSTAIETAILDSAYYYGIGIANLVNLTHPDTVILHGGLLVANNAYYQKVIHTVQKYLYRRVSPIFIRKSSLGEQASGLGAAIQVFEHFFSQGDA